LGSDVTWVRMSPIPDGATRDQFRTTRKKFHDPKLRAHAGPVK
jgi:hypothetical protein